MSTHCIQLQYAVCNCQTTARALLSMSTWCTLQGFLVVVPDFFKGNPRKKTDSADSFAAW